MLAWQQITVIKVPAKRRQQLKCKQSYNRLCLLNLQRSINLFPNSPISSGQPGSLLVFSTTAHSCCAAVLLGLDGSLL